MDWTIVTEVFAGVKYQLINYFKFATIAFVFFYRLFEKPLWFRKIQKKLPKLTDYRRDVYYSFIAIGIIAIINTITFFCFGEYTNVYSDINKYSMGYYWFTWVWMFLLYDTYFYWMHRFMHHPKIFKHVHLVHHKSTTPSPWTAYALHPLEAVIVAGILPIIAFTLPVHGPALTLFFLFTVIFSVIEHCGFEIYPKGFHKTWIGRWVNTPVAHDLHHHKFHGNYGLYFLFWDRLMGTVREDYDETFEKTTEGKMDLPFLSDSNKKKAA